MLVLFMIYKNIVYKYSLYLIDENTTDTPLTCTPLTNVYSCLGKESQQEVEELLCRQSAADWCPGPGGAGVGWPSSLRLGAQ